MSLSSGDLTTFATAKAYLDSAPNDTVLKGLITRVSMWIRNELNRRVLIPKTYTQQFNGTGTRALVLPEWPVLSIASLGISGVNTPISPQLSDPNAFNVPFGYRFQPWNGQPPGEPAVVELIGLSYLDGRQNVVATYKAGYAVLGEAATIPGSPFQVTPQTPWGNWATDEGITDAASGVAYTPVSNSPSTGQYIPPNPNASPNPILYYQFAPADVDKGVVLNYGYIPADLEQVCLELVAERAAYRQRVGLRSQMLASQESITYDLSGLPSYAIDMLAPYVSTLPPAMGADV